MVALYSGMEANMIFTKNTLTRKKTTVPRHAKLEKITCNEICKQLQIPKF